MYVAEGRGADTDSPAKEVRMIEIIAIGVMAGAFGILVSVVFNLVVLIRENRR